MHPFLVAAGRLIPAAALAAALFVSGCATAPQQAAGPAPPRTWVAYLQGDDLRQTCEPAATERYRLVYNSTGAAPVRVFDVVGSFGQGATIEARRLDIDSLAAIQPGDPLAAWDGRIDRARLGPQQFAALAQRLAVGGAFGPPGSRLNLAAERLRWFVTGCHAGDFFVAAYAGRLEPGQPVSMTDP
jgi:hypothetical protein